ncbi:hypothetical protein BC826DRAFT_223083 [Russula brevipes]|nr:hypothetical protein BC826DRAFT_223083 [Russula brevipes]
MLAFLCAARLFDTFGAAVMTMRWHFPFHFQCDSAIPTLCIITLLHHFRKRSSKLRLHYRRTHDASFSMNPRQRIAPFLRASTFPCVPRRPKTQMK